MIFPQVLDPCCGGRMFWFDKSDKRAVFCDQRQEEHMLCDGRVFTVSPDTIADFRELPFPDNSFSLIVFDQPHLVNVGDKSWIFKKYGRLSRHTWKQDINKGFCECWRVLRPQGTMIFKWNELQVKLKEILQCLPQKPLFGHTTSKFTHWMTFFKEIEAVRKATERE